jgi:hypothetical protein
LDCASSTIAGGAHNTIQATHATIAGGSYNTISAGAAYAGILGGTYNTIGVNAGASFAIGNNVTVSSQYSVAMAKGSYTLNKDNSFGSLFDYYFITGGNVGIGAFDNTTLPVAKLHVGGDMRVDVNGVGDVTGLTLNNTYAPAGDATTAVSLRGTLDNGSGTPIEAGRITFGESDTWLGTAQRNSYMSFSTRLTNVLYEGMRLTSGGSLIINETALLGSETFLTMVLPSSAISASVQRMASSAVPLG